MRHIRAVPVPVVRLCRSHMAVLCSDPAAIPVDGDGIAIALLPALHSQRAAARQAAVRQ